MSADVGDSGTVNRRFGVHNVVPPGAAVTRRTFLELLGLAGAGALVLPALACTSDDRVGSVVPSGYQPAFPDGVMAGDPLPDGTVIWTRLAATASGEAIGVAWEVATDDSFTDLVAGGDAQALAANDFTVKVAVSGLDADRWYHYRFTAGDTTGPVGRLRTSPAEGSSPTKLRFAWASCQQIGGSAERPRKYNSHRAIAAEEDLDFWMHLGDYVYVSDDKTLTVPDYRDVYATFKADPLLQELQARLPTVAMFDDGEFVNGMHRGVDQDRSAAALKVWFEQFPLLAPDGDPTRAYRSFAWGDLCDTFVIDVRQYRDAEVEATNSASPEGRARFDPERTTLGAAQRNWLEQGLERSGAGWRVIGNPYNMGMWRLVDLDEPWPRTDPATDHTDTTRVHPGEGLYVPNEAWDDFWFERKALLEFMVASGITNVLSFSGHTHIWLADVLTPDPDDPDAPVAAFDFTCGSLTPDPDFAEVEFAGVSFSSPDEAYDALGVVAGAMVDANPWKAYVNFVNQGYGVATVTPERTVVEFKGLNTYDDEATPDLLARFTVESGATTMRAELWPVPCYSCDPQRPAGGEPRIATFGSRPVT